MELDPGFSSDLSALVARLEEGVTTALDPRAPDDRRLIESFLDLSNKRSDRYPALHASLSSGVGPLDGPADDLRIVDVGRTQDGRATACAWHSAAGGAFLSGVATLALDSESHAPLAFGTGTQVGGSRATAATDVTAAAPAGGKVTALAFFHSQLAPDTPPRFGVALASRKVLAGGDFTIDVTEPTQTPRNPGNVVIAVSRMEAIPPNYCNDTDYCYAQEGAEPTYPYNLVPFTGPRRACLHP